MLALPPARRYWKRTSLILAVLLIGIAVPLTIWSVSQESINQTIGQLQVTFSVDHRLILSGNCVTYRWTVAAAQTVLLDDQPVPNPGEQQVCPGGSIRRQLHVTSLYGTQFTYSLFARVPFSTSSTWQVAGLLVLLVAAVTMLTGAWSQIPWLGPRLRHLHIPVPPVVRWLAARLFISLTVTLLIFVGIEIYFRYFFIQSDAVGVSYSAGNWYQHYWQPVNELGYRDGPMVSVPGHREVLFVGDSFVAGSGVNDIKDRMAGALAPRIADQYVVRIVAKPGWSTFDELTALKAYPLKPDVIVLGYFVDDIDHDIPPGQRPNVDLTPPAWATWLYTTNYLYWRFRTFDSALQGNFDAQAKGYDDPTIFAAHTAHLLELRDWAAAHNACVIGVLIPNVTDYPMSRDALSRVKTFLNGIGVPTLDVIPLVENIPLNDVRASPNDLHFNAQISTMIGNKIADTFFTSDHPFIPTSCLAGAPAK